MSASSEEDPFGNYDSETEVGVGVSDSVLLWVSIGGFAMMAFLVYSIILSRVQSSDELEKGEDGEMDYDQALLRADVASLTRAQRRARAKILAKRERRVQQGEEAEDGEDETAAPNSNLSRKERQKAAKDMERKERHLLDKQRQEEQREALQLAQEEKKKRLEMEAIKTREKQIRLKEEEVQKKQEEYDAWNTFLSCPDGSETMTVEEWASELSEGAGIWHLSKWATRFDLPTESVKSRINELVRECRVTGIVDEYQNTFFRFSDEHLRSLASFIEKKGEVSLEDVSLKAVDILSIEAI